MFLNFRTVLLVEIFQREPTKIIKLVKKVVRNRRFLFIFSTKTRYCSLDSPDRGTKVGFKLKYNSYMLRILVLEIFGKSLCPFRIALLPFLLITSFFLTFRWNKEKNFFCWFWLVLLLCFCENKQKIRVMQEPAVNWKNNFTVLSFFYEILCFYFLLKFFLDNF